MLQSLPTRAVPSPEVLFQELDGEGVLLHLENEYYYGLNEVGARLWQLIGKNGDVAAVVTQILEEYDVDESTLRKDLADLISELSEAQLLAVET